MPGVVKTRASHFLIVAAVLAVTLGFPCPARAQDASISGTVTDTTGGVLPGVTITAVHAASGTSVVVVSDSNGTFRLPVRVGVYRLTAELDGFAANARDGLEVLVGQQLSVSIQLAPATLQETLTVTGEAPLVNVTQSVISSNIDPRQISELPVNGRSWLDLTMLAAGSRMNSVAEVPANGATFQLNVDGQQVTQVSTTTQGQPRYSQDAIAEFQFVANRFDATQGRSSGVIVNAITKSGTNVFAGTVGSYFRHDRLNAADFIAARVLPYSDQQISATFGGPLVKNRAHFFANYEYERQPQTFSYNSPYPSFNFDLSGANTQRKGGVRFDVQASPQSHLAVRANKYDNDIPYDPRAAGGSTRHQSAAYATGYHSHDVQATHTKVLGVSAANELRVGWAAFKRTQDSVVYWPQHPNAYQGITGGAPIINLQGYMFGNGGNNPQRIGQDVYSVRDDLTYSFNKGGRHTLKLGAEALYNDTFEFFSFSGAGVYDATGGPRPANLETLFPVWNDVSTWNLNALNPIIRSYQLAVGNFNAPVKRPMLGAWLQDDWTLSQKFTLNLGLRYDYASNLFAQDVALPPFLAAGRPNEKDDFAPRLGFAYSLRERTVIRGGVGKYFSDANIANALYARFFGSSTTVQVQNDGRPDFATRPFNGPIPTFEQVVASGYRRTITSGIASPTSSVPYTYQGSIGVQHQLGDFVSVQADYAYTGERKLLSGRNINLTYNPATGANYPFNDVAHLVYPAWDQVTMSLTDGETNYHALQMAFTKRLSQRWQASATYTLARERALQPAPLNSGCQYPMTISPAGAPVCDVPITLAPDLQQEWYRTGQQAHRAVFNGIWEIGYGVQASGLYFFADNGRDQATAGVDTRITGSTAGRRRADGTLIPRFGIDRANLHRVDVRLTRKFALTTRVTVSGILDVFNLFNHANYGTYVTNERSATFGQPSSNSGIAFQPRMTQLGFRLTF